MRAMPVAWAVAIFAAAALGAAAAPTATRPTWVVLVDRSLDSPLSSRADGVKAVERAAEAARDREGRIYADGFTSDALARLKFSINADFSKPQGNVPDVVELTAKATKLLLPNLSVRGSDIVGAVLAAVKGPLSRTHSSALIVIESNMLVWSPDDSLYFTNSAPETFAARKQELDRLAARGRIPNLQRACVLVLGAGRLDENSIKTTRILAVEKFWRAYFARANARIVGWLPQLPDRLHGPCPSA